MNERPTVWIDLTPQQRQMICEATGVLEATLQRMVEEMNALPEAADVDGGRTSDRTLYYRVTAVER
jgi:hypothetical protein